MARLKLGVLISGRGSNLQALIDACAAEGFPAEVAVVISNLPEAKGLERAARAGIPHRVVDHETFAGRAAFEAALDEALDEFGVELVCLAGFMRLLSAGFVERRRDRVINIHPSLLPAFRGLDVQRKAIDAGVRFSGCTVHIVRPAMDDGPILAQAVVPIHPDDDAETLAARILEQEHRVYPLVVRLIAEGRVRVEGEKVIVVGTVVPSGAMLNPAGV